MKCPAACGMKVISCDGRRRGRRARQKKMKRKETHDVCVCVCAVCAHLEQHVGVPLASFLVLGRNLEEIYAQKLVVLAHALRSFHHPGEQRLVGHGVLLEMALQLLALPQSKFKMVPIGVVERSFRISSSDNGPQLAFEH